MYAYIPLPLSRWHVSPLPPLTNSPWQQTFCSWLHPVAKLWFTFNLTFWRIQDFLSTVDPIANSVAPNPIAVSAVPVWKLYDWYPNEMHAGPTPLLFIWVRIKIGYCRVIPDILPKSNVSCSFDISNIISTSTAYITRMSDSSRYSILFWVNRISIDISSDILATNM